ncbi:glycosyltransferase family 4 protein [Halobaculum sp. CBA1158]|uniref:glycosyltransferase family 4 protein n=1 Tax=Halobaculum sp. CBA1158 TaxID=2904243 RepID=UPI001F423ECF|nr:glycosyltransferase family 4 protein [Halobaculum sp. CBA1158]UIP00763.1 glycosyltransferase family 4 protein [Halobaculum sp. CBA1158]
MRVAVVSMDTVGTRDAPATRRTRRVARGLADRGHNVHWLCARWWGGEIPRFEHEGIEYHAVTDDPGPGRFRSKLPFLLRRVDPDVIHAVSVPPGHATTARTTARVLRVPVVVDWWERDPERGSGRQYRKAATGADRVTVPSETVRTAVREHGASDVNVRVIPESIDFDLVRESGVDDRFDVVWARDLDGDANVGEFLLALAELRDRDWNAAVVGDGPARDDAERTAADLRIDDRVHFLGDLSDEELVPVLKGAHVFAQTATYEPFATELLWALACGCVGIVEYQAGSSAHEVVEGLDRGRLVTNPQELADEIVACGGLSEWEINEGFAGFDHAEVLEEWVECYEAVVDDYGWL